MPRKLNRPASIATAAEYIGVSERTIYRWIASGHLAAYKIGPKLVRVDLDDVDRPRTAHPGHRAGLGPPRILTHPQQRPGRRHGAGAGGGPGDRAPRVDPYPPPRHSPLAAGLLAGLAGPHTRP